MKMRRTAASCRAYYEKYLQGARIEDIENRMIETGEMEILMTKNQNKYCKKQPNTSSFLKNTKYSYNFGSNEKEEEEEDGDGDEVRQYLYETYLRE